jgi:hypothetical protein
MESKLLTVFVWGRRIKKMHDFLSKDLSASPSAVSRHIGVDTCLVLQYHRVASLCFDPLQLAVEPYLFEKQVEYLAQNFNVISIDEMKDHLETSRPFRERTVVVTFDGGYSDVLYTAKEVLQRFKVPATVFTSSANIIEGGHFWWKELEDFLIANSWKGQLELEIDCQWCKWPLVTQLDKFRAYEDLYSILSDRTPLEQRTIVEQITRSLDLQAEELDSHRRDIVKCCGWNFLGLNIGAASRAVFIFSSAQPPKPDSAKSWCLAPAHIRLRLGGDESGRRRDCSRRPPTPPGIRFRTTAVHIVHCRRCN